MKVSENFLVSSFQSHVVEAGLVDTKRCHFGPDTAICADLELALVDGVWPENAGTFLLLEAKSHHSLDSPNTINKIFGQLLKETGKPKTSPARCGQHSFGVLIPADTCEWRANGQLHTRGSGDEYYRRGFRRIDRNVYIEFGTLVDAKFVLSFSVSKNALSLYSWQGFYDGHPPTFVENKNV